MPYSPVDYGVRSAGGMQLVCVGDMRGCGKNYSRTEYDAVVLVDGAILL